MTTEQSTPIPLLPAELLTPDEIWQHNRRDADGCPFPDNADLGRGMAHLEIAISRETTGPAIKRSLDLAHGLLTRTCDIATAHGRRAQLALDCWPLFRARAYEKTPSRQAYERTYRNLGWSSLRFTNFRRPFGDLVPGELYEAQLLSFGVRDGLPMCTASPREEADRRSEPNYNHDVAVSLSPKIAVQCKGSKGSQPYASEVVKIYMLHVLKKQAFETLGTQVFGIGEEDNKRRLTPPMRYWLLSWTSGLLAAESAGHALDPEATAFLDGVTNTITHKIKTKARHLRDPQLF